MSHVIYSRPVNVVVNVVVVVAVGWTDDISRYSQA
jgi:hypothetical protein